MWPFTKDDTPEWVKAREKRYKMIRDLIIENILDINEMPEGYSFVYNIPAKIECVPRETCDINKSIIEYVEYRLAIKYLNSCPVLGYQICTTSPRKTVNGFDFDHPYVTTRFDALGSREDQLEHWKVELARQLPDFFTQLQADVNYKIRKAKYEKDAEKTQSKRSVDDTRDILNCLRSKLDVGGKKND